MYTSTSAHINSERIESTLVIEFNRREKRNAFTQEMYQQINELLLDAITNPAIHVVLIGGQKDLFSAGNDLKDFLTLSPGQPHKAFDLLLTLATFPKPIVAAVGGDAIGIGTTLLLHCDFVVAADNARFQLPFVNLGVSPEGASSFLLPERAGNKLANHLLMLGEPFYAPTALRADIVSHIVNQDSIIEDALEFALKLATKPMDALITTKRLLKSHQQQNLLKTIEKEIDEFSRLLQTPACKELLLAFVEKRAPNPDLLRPSLK